MSQETNFYDWMGSRIRELVFENVTDFDGYLFFWGDYLRKVAFPKKYCVYQMEDLHNMEIFTAEYRRFLDGAEYVFDYSTNNISHYPKAIHLPLRFKEFQSINNVENRTILFYGTLSERRIRILSLLKRNGIDVRLVEGVYGKNLISLLMFTN